MKKFKHVVIWGHKLHSHTHSYIHSGFYRAFQSLGYDTHWFDDSDMDNALVRAFDFNNCLFITEGQACAKMPLIKGNKYVLHNCYDEVMWNKIEDDKIDHLKLQVYTDDILKYKYNQLENICTFYEDQGKTLFMPWATDLLPKEIVPFPVIPKTNKSWWVGTIGDGTFGNREQINPFINACRDNGIEFEHANNLSVEENRQRIAESYMAPAIVGAWQKEKNYIPCRIFKNISYGQFGITNSLKVYHLFEENIIYDPYEYRLFGMMVEKMKSPNYTKELTDLITFVREKHTYINRIETILSLL